MTGATQNKGPQIKGPQIKGWCPGALRPMRSGDGLVVRIRPFGGRLSRDQALMLSDLAARHGNGLIDLSNRANVQLRGVADASLDAVTEALAGVGLLDATPEAEARRNILVTPFWRAGDGTQDLTIALAAALASELAPALPQKFGFVVDTGVHPVLQGAPGDIRLERDTGGRLVLCAQGAALGKPVTADTAVAEMIQLADWFRAMGGITQGRGRMAALIGRGVPLPDGFAVPRAASRKTHPPGLTDHGALVALAFGQMSAVTLAALSEMGPLRVTPWRMLLIEGMAHLPDLPGLVADAGDPMLRVVACIGAPGCAQGHGETRALARTLAPAVPQGTLLHVSGCAKGCAHPKPGALTITATPCGYDLIRGGAAADTPAATGRTAQDLIPLISEPN